MLLYTIVFFRARRCLRSDDPQDGHDRSRFRASDAPEASLSRSRAGLGTVRGARPSGARRAVKYSRGAAPSFLARCPLLRLTFRRHAARSGALRANPLEADRRRLIVAPLLPRRSASVGTSSPLNAFARIACVSPSARAVAAVTRRSIASAKAKRRVPIRSASSCSAKRWQGQRHRCELRCVDVRLADSVSANLAAPFASPW
jgi:hypothetical protein